MLAPDTVRAHAVSRVLQAAEADGLDREEMATLAGFSEDDLVDPDRHVSFLKWVDLWHKVCDRIPDPDFGLRVGQMSEARAGGVLGYSMCHSSTLGSAIRRLQRFSRVLVTTLEVELETGPHSWRLSSRRPSPQPMFRQLIDAASAGLITTFREITGVELSPVVVRFTYPRPADPTALRRFYRCDLSFGEPVGGSIVLRASDMDLPTSAPEGRLSRYLDRLVEQELAALPKAETFARRSGRVVWRRLSEGQPTVAEVASEIGVSTRTLQRRLREEQTTYADVVEAVRRHLSITLLSDRDLTVYEIAYLLGYADPSAFNRAFRRWHDCSPGEYRQGA